MIKEKLLSRSVRLIFSGGVAFGLGLAAMPAVAQEADVQRVEITGSSIKRLASESSLPVTVMKAEDFAKQGLTTAEQVLTTLSSNQTTQGSSQSVGLSTGGQAQADLRGVGSNKTLVLLNGRRLANHPYDGATVDLNIIPIAALERVEVLRDGASAIYGTDAIGGVINFITKRSVKGVEVTGEIISPQQTGGSEGRINLLAGVGDLSKDGYNFFAVVDAHKQKAVRAVDRDFSASGVIPSRGLNKTSGNTPSANFFDETSGVSGNMTFANGCDPANHSFPRASSGTCRFDYSALVDDIPETQQWSVLGKGTFKLNEDNSATFEYVHSDSQNINAVAPPPFYNGSGSIPGLALPVTSPYYPGNGITPAFPGVDKTTGPLDLSWRTLEGGKRTEKDTSKTDRFLVGAEGLIAGWDYKTGFMYARGEASSVLTHGYLKDAGVLAGIQNGTLNPFAPQNAAGLAYINSIQLLGQTIGGKTTSTGVDFKASREFGSLEGGAMGIAIGGEYRKEKAEYDVNFPIATQASSTGLQNALNDSGERKIAAVFTEFDAPITKKLDLQLAARVDNYSDVGSTFNPKIGLRYQPAAEVLFRGSANTGFRAPSLYEKNQPNTVSNTANTYDDPKLCPGGVAGQGGTGTALPGYNPSLVCNAQQNIQSGGNQALTPEKARNYSVGIVLEPSLALTMSVDYWYINIRDSIGTLPESVIFGDPVKYASLYVRSPDGTLAYVKATNFNLGETTTSGVDLSLTYRAPKTEAGKIVVTMDGTYVSRYAYQNEKGGEFVQNVGTYADNGPVFRWKHNLAVQWSRGPWSAVVTEKYQSGYHDQNFVAAKYQQDVSPYSIIGVSGTYSGFKNMTITAGIKNLMNTNPQFSNQGTTFQQGYDPRFSDPIGRAYFVRATYKF